MHNISKPLENLGNLTKVEVHFFTKNKNLSYFILKYELDDVRIRNSCENYQIHYLHS